MNPRRPPEDSEAGEPRKGSELDTVEEQAKRSGRRRPPPRRGVDAIVDATAERRAALVVGALPAHVEVVFTIDTPGHWTRKDVQVVKIHPALIAAIQSPLVVGDEITVARLPSGQHYAVDMQKRRTLLARPAVGHDQWSQPLVSNADTLWVVVSTASPPMRPAMVDRFLVAAAAGGLAARLCATKQDLPGDAEALEWLEFYARLGIPVVRTSISGRHGLGELGDALRGHFSVLVGQSGVGKSSLIRAILPEQPIAVGEISEATGKGRHTTTVTRYYRLADGGAVVDTPGLRELGLWGAERSCLDVAFPDIARLAAACRFADCRHLQEPGCQVRESAEIPEARLASFRKLSAEIDQRARPGFGKPGGPTALR
jgi:ribosome biogenesis GTPase